MPPKTLGDRPMTQAERNAKQRKRDAERHERWEAALRLIAETCKGKAQQIAMKALDE